MNYQAPHEEWLEKILAKLSGELSFSDLVALNDHLTTCSSCTEALREYEILASHADTLLSYQQGSQLPARMLALKQEIMQAAREKQLAASLHLTKAVGASKRGNIPVLLDINEPGLRLVKRVNPPEEVKGWQSLPRIIRTSRKRLFPPR